MRAELLYAVQVPPDVNFREVTLHSPEYQEALRLRAAVLRAPLGLEFSPEEIACEPQCIHFAAVAGTEVVATLLLVRLDAETVKMRQVAVLPDRQGAGIGAGLVQFAEASAVRRGFREIVAHARETAVAFYERLGYRAEADTFLEATIPHRVVRKRLG